MPQTNRPTSLKEQWALEARTIRGLPDGKDYLVNIWGEQKAHRFGIHYHPEYMDLVYTIDGLLINWINGVDYPCPAGTVLIIRAGDFHDTRSGYGNFSNVVFHANEFERLVQDTRHSVSRTVFQSLLEQDKPLLGTIPESEREKYIENFHHLVPLQDTPRGYLALRSFLSETISRYLLPESTSATIPADAPEWLAGCLSEIYNAPQLNWTLDELLRLCHRSREHVCRIFKKHMRMTPTEFINERRLDRAERFLRSTRQSITEICFRVGFENLSYFHRLFRQRHDTTPLQYRKQHHRDLHDL